MGGKSTKLTPEELSNLVANPNIRCKITVSQILSSEYNFQLMRVKSGNSGMGGSMTLAGFRPNSEIIGKFRKLKKLYGHFVKRQK